MSRSAPIGVLDSGVGGLSILGKIRQLLPEENLLYVGDSAYAPYGGMPEDAIRQRCHCLMDFFLGREVKAVVLACNTATAAAVAQLREQHSLPIIGMEPAIKPAAEQSRSGVVGVLATAGTLGSDKFISLKSRFTDQVEIITIPCAGVVELIESIEPDREKLQQLLSSYLLPLLERQVDTLVLGCTHYSLITEQIVTITGPAITILDTGFAVALELQRRLQAANLLAEQGKPGSIEFFSSAAPQVQEPLFSRYWGQPVKVDLLTAQEQLI